MARKHHAKHSKNTILASSATKSFSKLSVGAASAVVGASLALSAAPALAQEMSPTDAQQAASTPLAQPANSAAAQNQQGRSTLSSKPSNQKTPNTPASALHTTQSAQKNTPTNTTTPTERAATSQQTDRAATPAPQPQVSDEVNLSADTKDTVPNMYAWGSSDNVFIENGQNHSVTFKFAKPTDGTKITKIAIFPADTNGVDNVKSRKFLEYYSDPNSANAHQSYSGKYAFTANDDGSATLTMTALYRDNNMDAEKYAANRCIYVYGNNKEGKEVLLYKTNIVRAATLVPPKTVGSIVLKYNEELTEQQIQDKLKAALDAPTAAKDGKSVRDQITAASKAFGVGGRTGENGKFVQTPDDPDKKVVITDKQAYDANQLATVINKVDASKTGTTTTYVTGVNNLKTYLVSDLGYKSEALPLTVARYDTRIDKPIVDDVDITKLTDDQKADICKKLAKLNHVTQDKVTFNDKGEVVINFDGVDAKDAPVIALKDLVIKRLKTDEYVVPTGDKATYVANPLGYSQAELARIKKSIYEANKDNTKLGLSATDYEKQITLSYITGDLTGAGDANKGRSNGLQENNISVTIKTDKALAEFTSDITKDKLTRLPDIRTDYKVELVKNKLDGRESDEGFSWSDDKHTTLIYRYDPTKAQAFTAPDILKLIKATPKDQNTGLRPLTGGETLDHEGAAGKARKSHMGYAIDKNGEPTTELTLGMMNGAYWIGNPQVANSDVNLGNDQSIAGKYTWDNEAGPVTVAGKKDKIFKTRLFVAPYALTYYRGIYTNPYQKNPNNTPRAINVIFVPQTNHKKADLTKSIAEHKTTHVEGIEVPTQSTYYNASDSVKKAYEDALKVARQALEKAGNKDDSQLDEHLKADIDNATITLEKARKALDGTPTNKEGLTKSLDAHVRDEWSQQDGTGTESTDKYKNVSEPDFRNSDGTPNTQKNAAAKKAKEAYDKALAEAKKLKDDENATQEAVDNAKAQLDAARNELNKYSTSKDKLNAALAEHGHVFTYTDDTLNKLTPEQKLATANPTYKNATPEEREAYDNALEEAMRLAKDPAASQKEVNEAIANLEAAKQALDAKATNKSLLEAQLQTSRDHDGDAENQKSVFYKNGKDPNYFADTNTKFPQGVDKEEAKQYADKYDEALAKAKEVLNNKDATQQQVNDALTQLKQAEENLHKLQSDASDLVKTLADNFTGYLLPAYFNAFNLSQSKDPALAAKAQQAAEDFKKYNDAYHAAKQLQAKFKEADPAKRPSQQDINAAKTMLEQARAVIDSYATDTSKLSVAILSDVAITASPAYKNAKALADKQNPTPEEQAKVEEAKKAVEAYQKAMAKIHQAFDNHMPKDQKDGHEIPADKAPDAGGDTSSPNYLDGIQSHAQGQPLNKDVTDALADFNKAREDLNAFATHTDALLDSVNEHSHTEQTPAYKNTIHPRFQKDDGSGLDTDKNDAAFHAKFSYEEALNEARELLKDPTATQDQVDDARKRLDFFRETLNWFKNDTSKLKESVEKHGNMQDPESPAAKEGTVTSDAYRNASDPQFMKEEGGKLVPDTQKNDKAAAAKKAYDEALKQAQKLLAKAEPTVAADAQPIQVDIDKALKNLDEKRAALDEFATKTDMLQAEADKSQADGAQTPADTDFENTPEFKNALYKQGVKPDADPAVQQAKADVETYKNALKTARELLAKKDSATLSERPTQKQIDDALAALKQAKQAITNGYKTNTDKLTEAKDYANGDFKKTPEYKNADAIKGDNANAKHEQAAKDVDGTDDKPGLNKLIEKITQKLQNANNLTQREVDTLLKQLKSAQKKIADNYKTDVKPLANEVGDKDQDGNPIVPAFEESVTYKNALDKQNSGDADATAKLKDYNDKLDAAQKLLDKVANPDPNAKPEDRPTNADVVQALEALKTAKKAIDDTFKTKAGALKLEADDKDEHGTAHNPAFEATTEYQNALGEKNPDGTDNADVQTYKKALEHAKKLLEKFDETGNPKAGAQDVPTQKDVDEALANLKDIKDKIKKNYVTNPHDLQEEVDKSKDGEDDTSEDAFENTPEFKNVSDRDDEAAKKALQDYTTALKNARELLDKFDRSTGKPKAGVSVVPTQKQLDDALKALQKAKQAILDGYKTDTSKLVADVDAAVDVDNKDYRNASREAQEAYDKALAAARAILKNPKATQAEIDAAQRALMLASNALMKSAHRPKLAPQQPARTNAPKHLAATSDPTNTFAVMGMITSAFGLIFAGAKRKRQRRQ